MEVNYHGDQDWYTEAHRAIYTRYDNNFQTEHTDENLLKTYHENATRFHLDTSEHVLSFGPGTGTLDMFLAQHCMPRLKSYVGVDPNAALLQDFETNMRAVVADDVKVEAMQGLAETYPGPEEKVDLILLMSVLYHVPEPKEFITRCLQWLNPGGHLLIKHADGGTVWSTLGKSETATGFQNIGYRTEEIREDLRQLGYTPRDYDADVAHTQYWSEGDIPKSLYDFMLFRDSTEEERKEVDRRLAEGKYTMNTVQRLISVPKLA